ncbi:MAG: hypothetical protein PW791_11460 [Neorhizobium sp.]|nr:hypothetical protein [Neorhizobium sp.]
MQQEKASRKFGIDPKTGRLVLWNFSVPLPRSRLGRVSLGSVFIVGGTLGFLPILGYWMIPVGIVVLSHDLSFVRRRRRRLEVWWGRRRQARQEARRKKSAGRPQE